MSKYLKLVINSIFFIIFSAACLQAQFIIQQVEYEIPVSYSLIPEDVEIESEKEEALFFMTIPVEKLKQAAVEEGQEVNLEESFIYVDGDNFASEHNSKMGKMSIISNSEEGIMYMVRWAQKTVVSMTPEDLKQMEEQTNKAMEESLKMMSPEMQAQVREAMKQEQQNKSAANAVAIKTGKKMTVNGFNCELYLIENEDDGTTGIWAAADNMKITGDVEKISEKVSKIFISADDEDTDEWSLVRGMIPVEVREMNIGGEYTSEPVFNISSIQKIEKKTPPADKFYVPGEKDGFTRMSFSDMMGKMMPGN